MSERAVMTLSSAAALAGAIACGELQSVGTDPPVLAVIRGRVTDPRRLDPEISKTMRVGVLWAGVPVSIPYCNAHGPTPLEPDRLVTDLSARSCRDPFEVVPAMMGPSVPFDGVTGAFEIVFETLPSAEVMVGTRSARVAYGSIIVFQDEDGDGVLQLRPSCRDAQGGATTSGDFIASASFDRLTETQLRLVYVEGPFDADSYFYPHPSCSELPPRGFSLWTVGSVLESRSQLCHIESLDQELTIALRDEGEYSRLLCRQSPREAFTEPPPDDAPLGRTWECTKDGTLVVAESCACPGLRTYRLSGCAGTLDCPTPEWDLRNEPPEWWPCEDDGGS
ncbi:MAG: hypothetical protein IT384_09085 [Deltaproteobacteria bacterium]|nr:hypothetical protein [Deltaproteobacteria bacterium]